MKHQIRAATIQSNPQLFKNNADGHSTNDLIMTISSLNRIPICLIVYTVLCF